MLNESKELFHASADQDIEILKPRAESFRNKDEGPVVFATDSKEYASMFIVPSVDSWTIKSGYKIGDNPRIWVQCIADEKRYRDLDKGGAIYTLPTKTFTTDPEQNSAEWISSTSVKPIRKEIFTSGIGAMVEMGVQVYFVTQNQFKKIKKSPENTEIVFEILKSIKSENEKKGEESLINKYF